MSAYVILRQLHNPGVVFDYVRAQLSRSHAWLKEDGRIEEWVSLPHAYIGGENFQRAATFLARSVEQHGEITALVDEVDASKLNPLESHGWSTLIAMLVLAFPEIRWHFMAISGKPSAVIEIGTASDNDKADLPEGAARPNNEVDYAWIRLVQNHGATATTAPRGSPLFDGYGIRQYICHLAETELRRNGKEKAGTNIPNRAELAVVLDDESGFALFESLAAYRNGFRVHAIASWREAKDLLGPQGLLTTEYGLALAADPAGGRVTGSDPIRLSIEDFFINYPDQGVPALSDLDERERLLPALGKTSPLSRRFVTVGHKRQPKRAASRRTYLRELRKDERMQNWRFSRRDQLTYKPISGLYTLWLELGMHRALPREGDKREGLAKDFIWPPVFKRHKVRPGNDDGQSNGHSSPGRLLQIAEHLIGRAQGLIDKADEVAIAVRGAVLATQALELLGCRTPTMSVEALLLKHRFEVTAECQFVGVAYHLSVHERLRDIQRNLKALSHYIHRGRRNAFCRNSEAMILSRIIEVFDQYGEFEESHLCQLRLRSLHRQISAAEDWRRGRYVRIIFWPFWMYINWTHRSLGHFFWTVLGVAAGLAGLFYLCGITPYSSAIHQALCSMVDTSPVANPDNVGQALVGYLAAVTGLVHFGILISYIYDMVKRR